LDLFFGQDFAIPDPLRIFPFQDVNLPKFRLFKTKSALLAQFFEGIMNGESLFCGVPVRIFSLPFFPDQRQNLTTLRGDQTDSGILRETPRFTNFGDHISF
jgi:hypothetical protein